MFKYPISKSRIKMKKETKRKPLWSIYEVIPKPKKQRARIKRVLPPDEKQELIERLRAEIKQGLARVAREKKLKNKP